MPYFSNTGCTIGVAFAWTRIFPGLARVDRLDDLRPVEAVA